MTRSITVFFLAGGSVKFDNVSTLNFDAASNAWMLAYDNNRENTIVGRELIKLIHSVLTPTTSPEVEEPSVDEGEIVESEEAEVYE